MYLKVRELVQQISKITLLFFIIIIILQPEDHRPMWYIHTITGEHRY